MVLILSDEHLSFFHSSCNKSYSSIQENLETTTSCDGFVNSLELVQDVVMFVFVSVIPPILACQEHITTLIRTCWRNK